MARGVARWRALLLRTASGDPCLPRTDRGVGMVVPGGSIKGPETWGSALELLQALAARIPIAFILERLEYSAGVYASDELVGAPASR